MLLAGPKQKARLRESKLNTRRTSPPRREHLPSKDALSHFPHLESRFLMEQFTYQVEAHCGARPTCGFSSQYNTAVPQEGTPVGWDSVGFRYCRSQKCGASGNHGYCW